MNAVQIGPLVLGMDRAAALAGIAAFLLLAELLGRRMGGAGGQVLRSWAGQALILGLIAARLGQIGRASCRERVSDPV